MSATCRRHVAAMWHCRLFSADTQYVSTFQPIWSWKACRLGTCVRTYLSAYILLTTRRKLLPKQRYLLSFLASLAPRFAIRARRMIHVLHKTKRIIKNLPRRNIHSTASIIIRVTLLQNDGDGAILYVWFQVITWSKKKWIFDRKNASNR